MMIYAAIEIAGYGISVEIDNKMVYVGNEKLMTQHNIDYNMSTEIGTNVYVAEVFTPTPSTT